MEPIILESARKHEVADEDIMHAFRFTVTTDAPETERGFVMAYGPARNGTMLEIGLLIDREPVAIIHAMQARK